MIRVKVRDENGIYGRRGLGTAAWPDQIIKSRLKEGIDDERVLTVREKNSTMSQMA